MRQGVVFRAAEAAHLLAGWGLRVLQVLTLGNLPPVVGVGGVVERDGHVLALRRRDGKLALPGGVMRYGETCDVALQRELREETGSEVAIEGLVGVYSGPARARNVRAVVIVYRCRWLSGHLSGSYEGEPTWLPLDALPGSEEWAFGGEEAIADMKDGRLHLF
jgi:ADP-ribose pyrophosphatase YjhB (NUDIX family)